MLWVVQGALEKCVLVHHLYRAGFTKPYTKPTRIDIYLQRAPPPYYLKYECAQTSTGRHTWSHIANFDANIVAKYCSFVDPTACKL